MIDALRKGIEDAESFFAAPPPDLMGEHSLDPSAPLTILLGPDLESTILTGGRNLMDDGYRQLRERRIDFLARVRSAFAGTGLLWEDKLDPDQYVKRDGRALEILLAPRTPGDICDHYCAARSILETETRAIGGQAFVGNGHWHVSMALDGVDVLRPERGKFSTLFRHACAGLLVFQELYPAFFVKPAIADAVPLPVSNIPNPGYRGPQRFIYRDRDARASIRCGNLGERQITIEPRLAVHAPFQPVYLTLAALRYGLSERGFHPSINETHAVAATGFDPARYKSYDSDCAEDAARFQVQRGPGGYLKMIEQTAAGFARHPLLPVPIFQGLLRIALDDYDAYLDSPKAQMMLTQKKIAALRDATASLAPDLPVPPRPVAPALIPA